jgi:hypothetical protein
MQATGHRTAGTFFPAFIRNGDAVLIEQVENAGLDALEGKRAHEKARFSGNFRERVLPGMGGLIVKPA